MNAEGVTPRYRALQAAIEAELARWGRPADAVTLVGVTKRQPFEAVDEAVRAGLRDVGENYLQEAAAKLADLAPVRKHFIGHLQTNKAAAIAATFDVVQSLDRIGAVGALGKAASALEKRLRVLVQLNVSGTERFGCPPQDAERLAEAVRAHPALAFDGVMAMGPNSDDPSEILRAFELAAKTFARLGGSTLSIGMSGDWRLAVRAGSTMVRLGTALFGGRNNP